MTDLELAKNPQYPIRHLSHSLRPTLEPGRGRKGWSLCGQRVLDQAGIDWYTTSFCLAPGVQRTIIVDLPRCRRCERLAEKGEGR